ncbi:hypothetical protein TVAG_128020 [Trichomonas vaginalis G3]|uniref:Exportin-1/Importin-beta-like domain-containing protein n=1 Tax=Trichomonas vaginalis (strain ATCC PRA-98 / G3) TaxID=412133 RepID=A2EBG3_TRIV3|nr:armadillo (ARM) repeat-containing protein family [Trichomonas vaginalis G3]EAY09993.1 hypothetical protein TVAG_128020 [Trichomonas vaginalis G3]KAI5535073.1 armadillo (ARM) repeat-containing protein family [Trichomonas vaginalis G3]|eukprot:XP_001322216.1 hypothetical protein [Trichomonas vaginalis G3]
MDDFNQCAERFFEINEQTQTIEKTAIFSTLNQVNSNFESIIVCIQNFNSFSSESAQIIILNNLSYWILHNWETFISNIEVINLIRDLLFNQNLINCSKQSTKLRECNTKAQIALSIRVYPEIWENLYNETIFSESTIPQALQFITEMSNTLANPSPILKDLFINYRNTLVQNKISELFQQFILNGIANSDPQAFIALGYYSIAFDNSWISDSNIFGQVGLGMSSPKTSSQTLECIRLMLMSNFTIEQKNQIIDSLNLCQVVISENSDPNIMTQYSKILYLLSIIYNPENEIYQTVIEASINHLLSVSDEDVIYSCQTLNSALTKKPEQFTALVCQFSLKKLYEFNKSNYYITPPVVARHLISLIEKCCQSQTDLSYQGYIEFTNEIQNAPTEDLALATTILQFVRRYRTFIQQRNATDETEPISDDFMHLYNPPENPIENSQLNLYSSYFDLILTHPKEHSFVFQASLNFIMSENCPLALTNFILKLLKIFIYKKPKLTIEDAQIIEQLINSGNPDLIIISAKLLIYLGKDHDDSLELCLSSLISQINSSNDPRQATMNVINFISSYRMIIKSNQILEIIQNFVAESLNHFTDDDYIIGNVSAILPFLGEQAVPILEVLLNEGGGFWWLCGVCRAVGSLTQLFKQMQATNKMKNYVLLNQDWQNQAFTNILTVATNLFEFVKSFDYHYSNIEDIEQCFDSFFWGVTQQSMLISNELFLAFIDFLSNFCVTFYDLNHVFDKIYYFVNSLVVDKTRKIEGFMPWQILPQLHSFLFNQDFDVNKNGTVISKEYFAMMHNMFGKYYQNTTKIVGEIFHPFQLDSNFVSEFIGDFEKELKYAVPSLHMHLETIILYKAFIIHEAQNEEQ